MTLNYVTLTGRLPNAAQGQLVAGKVQFVPSGWLPAPDDGDLFPPAPATITLQSGEQWSIDLLATDNEDAPSGWTWTATFTIAGIVWPRTFTFFLPFSGGVSQDISALVEATPSPPSVSYLPLPSGTPESGDVPIATGTGQQTEWGPSGTGGSGYPASPTVSGTPATGQVLTATSPTTADWQTPSGGGAVSSVFGRTGAVVAASGDYTVAEVTGAAPLASPALTGTPTAPTAAALTDTTQVATTAYADSAVGVEKTRAETAEALLAPLASPALTGSPTAPTQTAGDTSTKIATDAFAATAAANAQAAAETFATGLQPTSGAPLALTKGGTGVSAATDSALLTDLGALAAGNNLSELANAGTARTNLGLGTAATQSATAFDASGAAATAQSNAEAFATSAVGTETTRAETAEALLAPLASPALTGTPTAPTQVALNNSTRLATTAYADSAVGVEKTRALAAEALLAPLASPALTGTPTAPTKTALTNNTDIATTAYADAAVAVETTRAETAEALALPKAGGTMTGWLAPAVVALTFAATVLVNAALGNAFNLTLTASTATLGAPSNPVDGQVIRFRVTQGTGGSFTLAYNAIYDFGAAGAPTLSTVAGKVDILGFEYVASISKWCYVGSGLGF